MIRAPAAGQLRHTTQRGMQEEPGHSSEEHVMFIIASATQDEKYSTVINIRSSDTTKAWLYFVVSLMMYIQLAFIWR